MTTSLAEQQRRNKISQTKQAQSQYSFGVCWKDDKTAYQREWAKARRKMLPERYKQTDKKWHRKYYKAQITHSKIFHEIKMGRMKKPTKCSCCKETRPLQGHHPDYDKPLEVIWLCSSCHTFLHNYLRNIEDIARWIEK